MKQIVLDCAKIEDRRQLHEALGRELAFPEWYGHNLDALHDCLTELPEEVKLILFNWRLLQERLGDYAARLIYVLHCSSEENPKFQVDLEN